MDDRYREHIKKNINALVLATNYKRLLAECENKMLISSVMRSRIDDQPDTDERVKHEQLFKKLTQRGPDAYDELNKILIQSKFAKAANILAALKYNDSNHISMHNPTTIKTRPSTGSLELYNPQHTLPEGCYPSKDKEDSLLSLKPFEDVIQLANPLEVKKSKTMHYDRKIPFYPMKSKNRGVLFMVNIIDFPKSDVLRRSGAEIDGQSLLYLFKELGFTCFSYENLTSIEFFEIFEQLRSSDYLQQTESFVMALMTHGEMTKDMHDRVEFYDGSVVKVKDIEDLLSNVQCLNLVNKPKVLLFPFCRGKAPDKVCPELQTDSMSHTPALVETKNISTRSDILVCYATVRDFQAMRDKVAGSWYIQEFCRVLAEHAHDTHLEDMLKLIGENVKKLCTANGELQTPAFYNHGFNKLLFFNPGVYEVEE